MRHSPATIAEARLLRYMQRVEVMSEKARTLGENMIRSMSDTLDQATERVPGILRQMTGMKEEEQQSVLEAAKRSLTNLPENVRSIATQNLQELETRVQTFLTRQELTYLRELQEYAPDAHKIADAIGAGAALEKTTGWWGRTTDIARNTIASAKTWGRENPQEAIMLGVTATLGGYALYQLGRWLFGGKDTASTPGMRWYHWVPIIGPMIAVGAWGVTKAFAWYEKNKGWLDPMASTWMGKGKEQLDEVKKRGKDLFDEGLAHGKQALDGTKAHVQGIAADGKDLLLGEGVKYGLTNNAYETAEELYRKQKYDDIKNIFSVTTSHERQQSYDDFIKAMNEKYEIRWLDVNGQKIPFARGDVAIENYTDEIIETAGRVGNWVNDNKATLIAASIAMAQIDAVRSCVAKIATMGAKITVATWKEFVDTLRTTFGLISKHPAVSVMLGGLGACGSLLALLETRHALRQHFLPQNIGALSRASGLQEWLPDTDPAILQQMQSIGQKFTGMTKNLRDWVDDKFQQTQEILIELPAYFAEEAKKQALEQNAMGLGALESHLQDMQSARMRDETIRFHPKDIDAAKEAMSIFRTTYIEARVEEDTEKLEQAHVLFLDLQKKLEPLDITIQPRGEKAHGTLALLPQQQVLRGVRALLPGTTSIMQCTIAGEEPFDLCVDPHAGTEEFLDASQRIHARDAAWQGEWVLHRLANEAKQELHEALGRAPGNLADNRWAALVINESIYFCNLENTAEFFATPLEITRDLVGSLSDQSDKSLIEVGTDYVIAGVKCSAFILTAKASLAVGKRLLTSGTSFTSYFHVRHLFSTGVSKNGGAVLKGIARIVTNGEPMTGLPRLAESVSQTFVDGSLRRWMRLHGTFKGKGLEDLIVSGLLKSNGIRPQWIIEAKHIETLQKALSDAQAAGDAVEITKAEHALHSSLARLRKISWRLNVLHDFDAAATPLEKAQKVLEKIKDLLDETLKHKISGQAFNGSTIPQIFDDIYEWGKHRLSTSRLIRTMSNTEGAVRPFARPVESVTYGTRRIFEEIGAKGKRAGAAVKGAANDAVRSVVSKQARADIIKSLREAGVNLGKNVEQQISDGTWWKLSQASPEDFLKMGNLSRSLTALGIVANAASIVEGYVQWQEANTLQDRATSQEMKDIYGERKVFASANILIGTTGVVTGGASLLASYGVGGTAIAAVASTPISVMMAPLAVALGAAYGAHRWYEALAMNPEELVAQYQGQPEALLSMLQDKDFTEEVGQNIVWLLKNPQLHIGALPAAIAWSFGLYSSETKADASRKQSWNIARIAALALMLEHVGIPTSVRDATSGEPRPLTTEETMEYKKALDVYVGTYISAIGKNCTIDSNDPLANVRDLPTLMRQAAYEATLRHTRYVERRIVERCNASGEAVPPSTLPDPSLPLKQQIAEMEQLRHYRSLGIIAAEAQTFKQSKEHVAAQIMQHLGQEQRYGMVTLNANLASANFVDWWPDWARPDNWIKSVDRQDSVRAHILHTVATNTQAMAQDLAQDILKLPSISESGTGFQAKLEAIVRTYQAAIQKNDALLIQDPAEVWHALSSEHLEAAEKSVEVEQRLHALGQEIAEIEATTVKSKYHVDYNNPDMIQKRLRLAVRKAEALELGGMGNHELAGASQGLLRLIEGKKIITEMKSVLSRVFLIDHLPEISAIRIAPRRWLSHTGSILFIFNPDTAEWEWSQSGDVVGAFKPDSIFHRPKGSMTLGTSVRTIPMQQELAKDEYDMLCDLTRRLSGVHEQKQAA